MSLQKHWTERTPMIGYTLIGLAAVLFFILLIGITERKPTKELPLADMQISRIAVNGDDMELVRGALDDALVQRGATIGVIEANSMIIANCLWDYAEGTTVALRCRIVVNSAIPRVGIDVLIKKTKRDLDPSRTIIQAALAEAMAEDAVARIVKARTLPQR